MSGHIFAHISCTRVNWDCDDVECDHDGCMDYPNEEHGWIDRSWSPTVLHDSRNDVSPVVSLDEGDEDLAEEVRDALGWLEGGCEDNGDGTFYASDSYHPYTETWSYDYAIHFTVKYHNGQGWVEHAWHPVKDGGIEL